MRRTYLVTFSLDKMSSRKQALYVHVGEHIVFLNHKHTYGYTRPFRERHDWVNRAVSVVHEQIDRPGAELLFQEVQTTDNDTWPLQIQRRHNVAFQWHGFQIHVF